MKLTSIIPRGGTCPSCKKYTLWGDIVRGAYRRLKGGQKAVEEEANELSEEEEGSEDEDLSEDGSDAGSATSTKGKGKMVVKEKTPRGRPPKIQSTSNPVSPKKRTHSPQSVSGSGLPLSKARRTTAKKNKVGTRKMHTIAGRNHISDSSLECIDIDGIY